MIEFGSQHPILSHLLGQVHLNNRPISRHGFPSNNQDDSCELAAVAKAGKYEHELNLLVKAQMNVKHDIREKSGS